MKIEKLETELLGAQVGAKIILTFRAHAPSAEEAKSVGYWLAHFHKTGRVMMIGNDAKKSQITVIKTPILNEDEIKEYAGKLADAVVSVEIRKTENFQIVLEQGAEGWQLRFTGGNKFLRDLFKHTCQPGNKALSLQDDLRVISDKEGTAIISLSSVSDDEVLRFSEAVAHTLNTELVLA